jgi:hypothetical protein
MTKTKALRNMTVTQRKAAINRRLAFKSKQAGLGEISAREAQDKQARADLIKAGIIKPAQ